MSLITDLIETLAGPWAAMSGLQRTVIACKAFVDGSFLVLPPILFTRQAMTRRSLLAMPILITAYTLSDLAVFFSIAKSADPTQCYIALGLLAYGITFFFWAQYTIKKTTALSAFFSSDAPEKLITTGPWALVRNPNYSAYLATYLAGFILTSSSNHPDHQHPFFTSHAGGITLSSFLVAFTVFYQAIREEEAKFAVSKLRGQYETYKKQVWMLLPLTNVFGR
ncbi:hypothetical protein BCV70DRAFT_214052 [Testicularia cyperi]|uniref:Protein-S-isoprenylcysteine O-methyltransferase n=1 Tax=Testicularia cyperi TaxID=1882483 RepID=A0A317XW38_9BASI|nr:hypothetical protein BCV70DRAFT_214052 [Testicularia cyperi]